MPSAVTTGRSLSKIVLLVGVINDDGWLVLMLERFCGEH